MAYLSQLMLFNQSKNMFKIMACLQLSPHVISMFLTPNSSGSKTQLNPLWIAPIDVNL